ncbi:MAG TPA: sulfate transporter CysZ [Gammaproteobacteria bacterium]|nr:sulfate transporter CysZ [Gammaproteobacteria bacterium]
MASKHSGMHYLLQGLRLIRQPGLRVYVIVPVLVSVLCFGGAIFGLFYWLDSLLGPLLGMLPAWLDWLRYLLWPLFALTCVLVVFYGFSILTNLLAAPFNGMLAEAVEQHLTGQPIDTGGWRALARDIAPSLFSELRKLLYFVLRALPLGLLFLIPGINIAAPFIWALFSAWMLAIEYLDYPLANHLLHFAAQRKLLRGNRLLAYGFGGSTLLLTMIPVLNFIAMPAAVAGATALWVGEFKKGSAPTTDTPAGVARPP